MSLPEGFLCSPVTGRKESVSCAVSLNCSRKLLGISHRIDKLTAEILHICCSVCCWVLLKARNRISCWTMVRLSYRSLESHSVFSLKGGVNKRLIFLNRGLKLKRNCHNTPNKLKFCKYAASPGLHLPHFPS